MKRDCSEALQNRNCVLSSEDLTKILYISAFCPCRNGDNAAVVDAYYLLRELSKRHEITLVTFALESDMEAIAECRGVCSEVITVPQPAEPRSWSYLFSTARSFVSKLPAIAYMSHSPDLLEHVRRLARSGEFHVAHVQYTQLAHYIDALEGLPVVLEEGDIAFVRRQRFAESLPASPKKTLLKIDNVKLQNYEISYCKRYDGILVRSEADKQILGQWVDERPIESFPPWLDLSLAGRIASVPMREDIMFYGAMWRPVNEQAALYFTEKILPVITATAPHSRFLVVGSRPTAVVRNLHGGSIEVSGFVNDVAPYYSKAAVVVAPLLAGSGIKGKVIQALAYGRPVVTTSVGAEGISACESDGLFVRDDPEQFAECVVSLLRGKAYLQYCTPAKEFIARNYDWHSGVARVEKMYRTAIDSRECLSGE